MNYFLDPTRSKPSYRFSGDATRSNSLNKKLSFFTTLAQNPKVTRAKDDKTSRRLVKNQTKAPNYIKYSPKSEVKPFNPWIKTSAPRSIFALSQRGQASNPLTSSSCKSNSFRNASFAAQQQQQHALQEGLLVNLSGREAKDYGLFYPKDFLSRRLAGNSTTTIKKDFILSDKVESEPTCKINTHLAEYSRTTKKALPLFKTAIQKRLDKVLLDSQLVLIWATFKSRCLATTSGIRKNIADAVFKQQALNKKPLLDQASPCFLPTSPTNSRVQPTTVKISKFPKVALNEYCLNVNFSLVGCGVDLLVLHNAEPLALPTKSSEEHSPYKQMLSSQPLPQKKLCNLIKTQQAALFLEQALAASEATFNKEDRWDQNQLLGAFVNSRPRDLTKPIELLFISSSEVRQSLLLTQALETTPDLAVVQPFKEAVNKLMLSSSEQSRCINKLLTRLLFTLNRPKYQIITNSYSVAK